MSHDRILSKVRNGFYMRRVLRILTRLHIEIMPYYIEQSSATISPMASAPMPDLDLGFLEIEALGEVLHLEGKNVRLEELRKRIANGHRCFVAKHERSIIAKVWCDLSEFNYPPCRFDLQADEAYFYAMFTEPGNRGKGIAPFLRTKCYEALAEEGKSNFYSYSEYFNTPAKRFKKKLGTRNLALCLHVSLSKRFSWNWTIKKYQENAVNWQIPSRERYNRSPAASISSQF